MVSGEEASQRGGEGHPLLDKDGARLAEHALGGLLGEVKGQRPVVVTTHRHLSKTQDIRRFYTSHTPSDTVLLVRHVL